MTLHVTAWHYDNTSRTCDSCGTAFSGVHVCDVYSRRCLIDNLRVEVAALKQRIAELEKKT